MMFTDHLAAMVKSGTPLVEALETYIQDESGRKVAVVNRSSSKSVKVSPCR
jgi:type II secretory pathway component PulF